MEVFSVSASTSCTSYPGFAYIFAGERLPMIAVKRLLYLWAMPEANTLRLQPLIFTEFCFQLWSYALSCCGKGVWPKAYDASDKLSGEYPEEGKFSVYQTVLLPQPWGHTVRSYISIRNIVLLVLAVSYFAAVYLGQNIKLKLLVERVFLISKWFFGVLSFFKYAIAEEIFNTLFPDKTAPRVLSLAVWMFPVPVWVRVRLRKLQQTITWHPELLVIWIKQEDGKFR